MQVLCINKKLRPLTDYFLCLDKDIDRRRNIANISLAYFNFTRQCMQASIEPGPQRGAQVMPKALLPISLLSCQRNIRNGISNQNNENREIAAKG